MTTLEFHDPSGTLAVTQPHAPRIDGLAGVLRVLDRINAQADAPPPAQP